MHLKLDNQCKEKFGVLPELRWNKRHIFQVFFFFFLLEKKKKKFEGKATDIIICKYKTKQSYKQLLSQFKQMSYQNLKSSEKYKEQVHWLEPYWVQN